MASVRKVTIRRPSRLRSGLAAMLCLAIIAGLLIRMFALDLVYWVVFKIRCLRTKRPTNKWL